MEDYTENNEILENEAGESETEEPAGIANESKADKFQRLAVFRMNKVLGIIDQIGKLGNRSSYDYSEEQVNKMFTALRNALDAAEAKFKAKKDEGKGGFSF